MAVYTRASIRGLAKGLVKRDLILAGVSLLVVFAILLMITQLAVLFYSSLRHVMLFDPGPLNLDNFYEVIADSKFVSVAANTLTLGVGTVIIMLLFAVPFSWLYTRTDLPRKDLLILFLTVKAAVPGFLVAMGYIFLMNPRSGIVNRLLMDTFGLSEPVFNVYSLSWIIVLQGFALVTSGFFFLVPAFQSLDAALEEGAYTSGVSRMTTFFRIALPLVAPAIVSTAVFYFVVAMAIFDYAGMLGMPAGIHVFATWIYRMTQPAFDKPQYGSAAALGAMMTLAAGLAVLFYFVSLRRAERFAVLTGKRSHQNSTRLGRKGKWMAWTYIGIYLVVDAVVPILMLIWTSLLPYLQPPSLEALSTMSLQAYTAAARELSAVLLNTAILVLVVPTIAVTAGACLSWVAIRSKLPGRQLIDVVVMGSLAVPTIVGALAFLYIGLSVYRFIPIYTTIWLMVIAMSTRYLTYTTRVINGTMVQIHRELEEACVISSIPLGRIFLSVIIPMVGPAIAFSWFRVSMFSLGELTMPLMLSRPGLNVISTSVWAFQNSGDYNLSAAMGVIQLLIIGGAILFFHSRMEAGRY